MAAPSYYEAFQTALSEQPDADKRRGSDLLTVIPGLPGGLPLVELNANPLTDSNLGQVLWLPKTKAHLSERSIVHSQDHMNDGAFPHPCVPIAAAKSGHDGERLLFCCPASSFGGRQLTEKYAGGSRRVDHVASVLNGWMAIEGNGRDKGPLTSYILHPELQVRGGATTSKKTYVNLDCGYWIEAKELARFTRGRRLRLTDVSLNALQWAYGVAESYRVRFGSPSRVKTPSPKLLPLDYSQQYVPWAEPWFCVPYETVAMAAWGYQFPMPLVPAVQPIAPLLSPAAPIFVPGAA